ncbi:GNAT family N-acetyltransferase [Endozoicomonas sp. Mp262]|uniref:GNAT family N-acetyltransferase n=1 Tax=Endozoicomonas sp. Mp262 TaxID=2919499 RepID=UPI0021DABDE2
MRVVAETPHLLIRTWLESDLAGYATLIGEDSELNQYSIEKPASRAETELWRYQLELDRYGWSRWAVEYKENSQLIGFCGFSPYGSDVEIGWKFLQEYYGRGLVIEALSAVTELGFQALGFERVISFSRPDNQFVQGVMEQIGMTLEQLEGWSNCTVARYSLSRERL